MFVKSTSVAVFFPFSALAYSATCSNHHAPNHLLRHICSGPPDVYVVEPINGKGLGVFAIRDLDIGDIIMRESPVIRISRSKLTKGGGNPMAAVAKLVHDEFKTLSTSAQEQVLALSYYANGTVNTQLETVGTIFRTNAYNTGDKFSLFPRIARINHSCRPNTSYYWSEKLNKHIVFASRKIKAGEEFSVSYISLLLAQEDRQKLLDQYGFKCQCEACAQKRAASEASDNRRVTIKNAFDKFDSQLFQDPPKTKAEVEYARKSAEVSVQLAQLVQAEGLADYYARAYRIAALSFAKLENWQSATDWANQAYKLRHMEDPESPYTIEMYELTSMYISKWQTQLTGRS
ncbi:hypothetical protein COCCADRAFT_88174 [Bipolaris zeicola 26-R-13]|uniref:SET domain-containing protein n=1 Tax=Cochliobolus carbonum (strain 26-R-13) TaxID=930089 RepID=W6YFS3_COCC2|nr:uncharacterized protein COCCADRAFT_88174 [Bipolaris zeicola 26-R-13]EUC36493.1 hypothetical protein COCCADRAFT_88174 [Bipolaris zeicola 26-R-13]